MQAMQMQTMRNGGGGGGMYFSPGSGGTYGSRSGSSNGMMMDGGGGGQYYYGARSGSAPYEGGGDMYYGGGGGGGGPMYGTRMMPMMQQPDGFGGGGGGAVIIAEPDGVSSSSSTRGGIGGFGTTTTTTTTATPIVLDEAVKTRALEAPPFWGVTLDQKTARAESMWVEGPAYKAGIRPGDQIVRVNGVDVSNYDETLGEMKKTKVSEPSTITVLKEGGQREQYHIIPMTNRAEFKQYPAIYYDTSKTTSNTKIPEGGGENSARALLLKEQARKEAPPFWGVTLNEKDAKVKEMWVEGPAHKAGIRPGDQIVRVAGVDVNNYDEALAQMKKSKVGESSTITVRTADGGKKKQYKLMPLTNRPEYKDSPSIYYDTNKHYKIPKKGEGVSSSSSTTRKSSSGGGGGGAVVVPAAATKAPPFWGVTLDDKNAKVLSLWHEGPAWKAGLRPGDQIIRVDGRDVKNYKDTMAEMKKTKVGTEAVVTVRKKDDGKKKAMKLLPMTNMKEFASASGIYYDTSKHYKYPKK